MTDQEKLDLVPHLQQAIRELRARVDKLEETVKPDRIELRSAGSDYYLTLQVTDHGSGLWAGRGSDANRHPCVAAYTGFGNDVAVVGVYSAHDQNRPAAGIDACLAADRSGGHVQIVDEANVPHVFTAGPGGLNPV